MKSLMIKDLLNLKRQNKIFLAIFIYAFIFSTNDSPFLEFILVIFSIILIVNNISYDEKANWNTYILCMPVSRKDIIIQKYILGLIFLSLSFFVAIIFGIILSILNIEDIKELLFFYLGILSGGILYLIFLLPFIFKFGTEKGRILIGFSIVIFFWATHGISLETINEKTLTKILPISPILIYISMIISLKIFNKKEF